MSSAVSNTKPRRGRHYKHRGKAEWSVTGLPFQGTVEYRDRYRSHVIPPRVTFKPPNKPLESHKFQSMTENQDQYVSHKIVAHEKPKPMRSEWSGRQEAVPFEGSSTYTQEYVEQPIPPKTPVPKAVWTPSSTAPLDAVTTTRNDYRTWDLPKRPPKKSAEWQPTEGTLESVSTAAQDYREWKVQIRPPRPPVKFQSATEDRDFLSTAKSNYVTHPVEKRKERERQVYKPSEAKFDGKSTSAADYRTWAISRPIQIDKERLSGTKKYSGASSQTFEGQTIHRDSYKAWKTNKIELVKPPAPSNSAAPLGARFEGTSTQRQDFVPLAIPSERMSFRPNLKYNPAKEDREFTSQTRAAHDVKPLYFDCD